MNMKGQRIMSDSIVNLSDGNTQTTADERPITLRELKEAADQHFDTTYTICHLKNDEHLIAMLCNVGQPYSPVSTWLYVAGDEQGRLYFAKRRTGGREEDVELTRRLTEMVRRGR